MDFDDLFEDMGVKDTSRKSTALAGKYTKKIIAPMYEPLDGPKPHIQELYANVKYRELVASITAADIPEEDKEFLLVAATRHVVFNYGKIADYYAKSSAEVQDLMERSALVIIDFDKALEYGYTKLLVELDAIHEEDKKAADAK